MTDIFALVEEHAALGAQMELMVVTVNSGPLRGGDPRDNWTPERLAELGELQARYGELSEQIEAHPDYAKNFTRKTSRVVGARKKGGQNGR